ncbi:MAG: hypothetical protein NMNS01_21380 [Nitrosomonas sp.]|nr:MAG: hypothetical protein NMNS01_21380 [Nitrosomonas sp.]
MQRNNEAGTKLKNGENTSCWVGNIRYKILNLYEEDADIIGKIAYLERPVLLDPITIG